MAITQNNVHNVKFLRNGSVFTPSIDPVKTAREVALDAMKAQLNILADGTAILGRYNEGADGSTVKTLVGFAYISGDTKTLTVFDVDGAGADVEKKINDLRNEINGKLGTTFISSANTVEANLTALSGSTSDASGATSVYGAKKYANGLIESLDYTDAAVAGQYVSQVTQADGKIAVTRVALPDTNSVADDNKVVTDVIQSKGAITATAANITGVKLAGYAEGTDDDIATTDTLGEALGKLQAQINAMDKSADVVAGQVVTTVTEEDGKVTETKANVKDLQLGGYAKSSSTGAIASTDTINEALSKLENKAAAITIANADGSINVTTAATGTDINVNIKSGEHVLAKDGSAGVYTNIAISAATSEELSTLGTNVQEAYKLVATDGTKLGEFIKIYKDSSLVNLYLGHVDDLLSGTTSQSQESESSVVVPGSGSEALVWIVQLANGNYKLAAVDVESFLQESEFASGVTADSVTHIVHGVVDSASEKDESNVAFLTVGADGFKVSGIKDAIDTKINKLNADLSGNSTHVTVGVAEADGKITAVTVDETDIASQSLLDTLSGKTVTAVEMTGGTVAIAANSTDGTKKITINTDGSQVLMTGYAKGSDSGAVATSDSINVAIGKLENQIAGKVDALDATVSGKTADDKVKVQVVQENGVLTAVNVTGTDIASDSALTAEIEARKAVDGQNGQTYAANTGANYISGANSLNDADVKLDSALKIADDAMLIGVVAGNGIAVTDKANKSQKISAKVNGDGGIVNDTNGLHLGYIDCGTY